ncbi:ionotropic receptor 21a isoform X1 [Penaeus vannamei]|uniref:ionotropic receptor 21a isoform X1 n=1 Tax=Penaeus vannamei TaxID=6689 RepID=UPI00387F94BB
MDAAWGVSVFQFRDEDWKAHGNQTGFVEVIGLARKVRLSSHAVSVIVISEDLTFLTSFAERSLKGRLFVWTTRLLLVTRLALSDLRKVLSTRWTFSMMNTVALNVEENGRSSLYTHLPYSPEGAQIYKLGSWSQQFRLFLRSSFEIFPEKYDNFHGGYVNITSGVWAPFWDEKEVMAADGSKVKEYSGSDFMALDTIAKALNFRIRQVPTKDFVEVTQRVEERVSFIASIYYVVLVNRLERHDFTYTYQFSYESFCLSKPGLRPQWESLYYPLAHQVWAGTMTVLVIVPVVFVVIAHLRSRWDNVRTLDFCKLSLEVFKTFVGQNLTQSAFKTTSARLLITAWLVFSFIIGVAYRGNLTAYLTLPVYPPRPETVAELVETVERINMPSYGHDWKAFFTNSDSPVFQALGRLLFIGPSVHEGLNLVLEKNHALLCSLRYLEYTIAQDFTDVNGQTKLYIGRNPIFPSPAAWPIPHDAPYKPQLDRYLMAFAESGLYNKWIEDLIEIARRESSKKQEQQKKKEQGREHLDSGPRPLTVKHMQGPLMLLGFGLGAALLVFLAEFSLYWGFLCALRLS